MSEFPERVPMYAVMIVGALMDMIDVTIVNVALPSIGSHLHFSRDDLSWVVNAYVLTFGGFLLLGGRAADLLGRRAVFIAGVEAANVLLAGSYSSVLLS